MADIRADAERGDAGAQFALGVLFDKRISEEGSGKADDRAQAIYWLLRASRQGLPQAQARLAAVYSGRPRSLFDFARAGAWYFRAMARRRRRRLR